MDRSAMGWGVGEFKSEGGKGRGDDNAGGGRCRGLCGVGGRGHWVVGEMGAGAIKRGHGRQEYPPVKPDTYSKDGPDGLGIQLRSL